MTFAGAVFIVIVFLIFVWLIVKIQSRKGDLFPLSFPFRAYNFISLISTVEIGKVDSSRFKTKIKDHPCFGSPRDYFGVGSSL